MPIISILALVFLSVQVAIMLWVRLGLYRLHHSGIRREVGSAGLPPISVVIAARNASKHLGTNLEAVLKQDYPQFQVIVVNDRSTDDSTGVLAQLGTRYAHLRVIENTSGDLGFRKKTALEKGIAAAEHEVLVFTDADCTPFDAHWLRAFGAAFSTGAACQLGTGLFREGPGWVNSLYFQETSRIAALYHSAAAFGRPYMAVGRSLAYTKTAFKEAGGFKAHRHISSGDDDLMVQSIARNSKVNSVPAAVTMSDAPATLALWIRQKRRHLEAGRAYPISTVAWLALVDLSALGTWLLILPATMFATKFQAGGLLVMFGLRWLLLHQNLRLIYQLVNRPVHSAKLFWNDFLLSLLNPLLSVASQVRRD